MHALSNFNISTDKANLKVYNDFPRGENNQDTTDSIKLREQRLLGFHIILLDDTFVSVFKPGLIETKAFISPDNFFFLDTDIDYNGQKIRMIMFKEASGESPCNLNLVIPTSLPKDREVSLDSIPLDFTAIRFKYDFSRNPEHREKLSGLFQKRIDIHMVSNEFTNTLSRRQIPNGIEAKVRLKLQDPNSQNFCK